MKWEFDIAERFRPRERPLSVLELEGMLRMYVIQDHMTELTLRVWGISDGAGLSYEERNREEEEFRSRAEAKHVLFARPKEKAIAAARQKMGLEDPSRVQSYGDAQEKKILKTVAEFVKQAERKLHRMGRETLARANRIGGQIDRRSVSDIHSAMKQHRLLLEKYEAVTSVFEAVAGRKFMSA